MPIIWLYSCHPLTNSFIHPAFFHVQLDYGIYSLHHASLLIMICRSLSLVLIITFSHPLNLLFFCSALPCSGPVALQSASFLLWTYVSLFRSSNLFSCFSILILLLLPVMCYMIPIQVKSFLYLSLSIFSTSFCVCPAGTVCTTHCHKNFLI